MPIIDPKNSPELYAAAMEYMLVIDEDIFDEPAGLTLGSVAAGPIHFKEGETLELVEVYFVDCSSALPGNYKEVFNGLFHEDDRSKRVTLYPNSSSRLLGKEPKSFIRAFPGSLYELQDENGRRFVDELYNEGGYLFEAVKRWAKKYHGLDIEAFDTSDEAQRDNAYVGNGLTDSGQEFLEHWDTEGTVSALLFVSDIVQMLDDDRKPTHGGEFRIAYERVINPDEVDPAGIEGNYGAGIIPQAGVAAIFLGDERIHGGRAIDIDSTERLAIAFTWKIKGRYKGKNDPAFMEQRRSKNSA